MMSDLNNKTTLSFIGIVIGWMFYIFAYFSRVEPGVLVDYLIKDFSLNATQIGSIVSMLYVPYVAMQIPWGILVDKLGYKIIISLCCALCSIGVLIFASSTASWHLVLARIIIGFSSSAAYLSCGKVIAETLPSKYAVFMGVTMFVGGVGGTLGSTVTAGLAKTFGWRTLTYSMAIIGFVIAVLAFIFLKPEAKSQAFEKGHTLEGLKLLSKNPSCWLIGLYGCTSYLPLSAVAELWGTPFMQSRFNASTAEASICSSVIFIAFGLGSILAAKVAKKINGNKNTIILFSIGLILAFSIAIYSDAIGFWTCVALFGLGSLFAGSGTLVFDMTYKFVPSNFAGTSTGYTNMLVMMSGVIFQPLLGKLLDFFRNGKVNPDGTPLYDIVMYRSSFMCILAVIVISVIGMLFVKERK